MSNITYTGVQDIDGVVDYFLAHDELLVDNPVFAEASNVSILKESLAGVLSKIESEQEYESMLNYKNLLYLQLIHYCDSIADADGLEDDLHELLIHRIYTGTELKLLSWIFLQQYGREPDLSNPEGNSPHGFIRYLKLNCKPDVVAHFIGLALQQFIKSQYPDDPYYNEDSTFTSSYNYLCDYILETELPEKLSETINDQQLELNSLVQRMVEIDQTYKDDPNNGEAQERKQKLAEDFLTEKLEMEFLSQVVLRLF